MAEERTMPVSVLGLKLIYLYPWKQLESEFKLKGRSHEEIKEYIRDRIETFDATERRWVVIIAGLGFFADAYSLFSINMVLPMLGIVYYGDNHGVISPSHEMGIVVATLSGSLIGQLIFGIAADKLGRRKMYGWELVVTVFATIGVATASYGVNGSLSILGGLIAYRFILGLGIGADYPLSAVICSEFAPTINRARMLSSVFFFQPLGQLAASLVALIVTACFKGSLTAGFQSNTGESSSGNLYTYNCYQDQNCVRTVDIMWRIIIGLGVVPLVLALWFRLAILESPRYTADVLNENMDAYKQIHLMGKHVDWRRSSRAVQDPAVVKVLSTGRATGSEGVKTRHLTARGAVGSASVGSRGSVGPVTHDHVYDVVSNQPTNSAGQSQGITDTSGIRPKDAAPNELLDTPGQQAHASSAGDNGIRHYFRELGHGWTLFACCLCWFCVDLPFYGLGMNNPSYIGDIWSGNDTPEPLIYKFLLGNAWQGLIIVSIGAVTGGLATVICVKKLGEKTIQVTGFLFLFFLFIIIGASFKTLMDDGRNSAIVVLYLLCQVFFNFGPNATTYMIPAEFFPTRFRASSHGIAAACGKFGSVVAQIVVYFLSNHFGKSSTPGVNYLQVWLGDLLMCFSPFMLLGLLTTIFLVPNTTEADNKPSTLEVLAAEDSSVDNLMKRLLHGKADESTSLLRPSDERRSEEDQGSLDPQPDVERDTEQGKYIDNTGEQEEERRSWMFQKQLGRDRSENVELDELDEVNLGEPALTGPLPE